MEKKINLSSYKVGIYVRLSREDDDKFFNESESIKNQKDYLIEYVLNHGWQLIKIYSDDGYSGTTFDRPAFCQMIEDIENKKINTVITKDLSRLGRNYSKTGFYIDEYFPKHKIRYIAVNDNVDTLIEDTSSTTAFMGVVNDIYAKDISKKVRSALKTKQKNGEYIGTFAPFGYKKSKTKKGQLVIDKNSSIYVKRIFNDFLSGKSINKIAIDLTNDNIPTPSEYLRIKNSKKQNKFWNGITIRRILQNEVYIGNTVQNKKQKINYKVNKECCIPKENWIKKENTHEAIIKKEDFNLVNKILTNRSYIPKTGNIHLFTGYLFCANCGARITYCNRYQKDKFYCICSIAKNYKKIGKCDMICIKEEEIENIVKRFLKELSLRYINNEDIINTTFYTKLQNLINDKQKEKDLIASKLQENNKILFELYKDKVSNIINEDTYISLQNQTILEKENQEKYLTYLDSEIKKIKNINSCNNNFKNTLNEFLKFDTLNRNILSTLIEKILIYKNNNGKNIIKIYCNFKKQSKKL